MKHDVFIERVRTRAGLGSREEATRAIRATLETLAERLRGGEARDLASELPPEIGRHLLHDFSGLGERLSIEEFYALVAESEATDPARAAAHARAVVRTLVEAVSPGEIDDVLAQLPPEYADLFGPPGEAAED